MFLIDYQAIVLAPWYFCSELMVGRPLQTQLILVSRCFCRSCRQELRQKHAGLRRQLSMNWRGSISENYKSYTDNSNCNLKRSDMQESRRNSVESFKKSKTKDYARTEIDHSRKSQLETTSYSQHCNCMIPHHYSISLFFTINFSQILQPDNTNHNQKVWSSNTNWGKEELRI